MEHKICTKCKVIKPLSEFSGRKKLHSWCKSCLSLDHKMYKDTRKKRIIYSDSPARFREATRKARHKSQHEAIMAYGGYKCRCECGCEETEPLFLTIDHINNDGVEHRKKVKPAQFSHWLKSNGYPEGYAVLCMNCNWGKARNIRRNGIAHCPREVLTGSTTRHMPYAQVSGSVKPLAFFEGRVMI